ncbi:MAG: DUF504 domain-containing protein [Nanoarchaeota archaeon]|nr:DUF504 domain-containing protein [Nanoarchaeota archaeon]MBU1632483.1 DUF504 domain-containing protein [Nanoarchaeota archaeon]
MNIKVKLIGDCKESNMVSKEQIRRYSWYLFGLIGIVFFWAGVWDGIGSLPYLHNPLISLVVGLLMILFSKKLVSKVMSLGMGFEERADIALNKVHYHPKKHLFHIKYKDKIKKKEILIKANKIKSIEEGFLVFLEDQKEVFIPIHRVTEILHKGKRHWKA